MKFIAVEESGELTFSEADIPQIDVDECLIKVKAIGVNRADILQREGKYPPPKGESDILGIEVSGKIIELGQQVDGWRLGDRICCLVAGGGYSEYVKVKASHMIKLPAHYDYSKGAAIAETFLTAYQCLFSIGQLQPEEKVLIHAGASGVGTSAIQLAKAIGCYVVVTTSSDEKANACLALGADEVINYRNTDFAMWSKEHSTYFDVIVDVVAGDYLNKNVNAAALDGRVVMLSMLGGRFSEQLDIAKLLVKRLTITATTLRNRDNDYKTQLVAQFLAKFSTLLNDGVIKPVIDTVVSWQKVEQAHQILKANQNIGKVVLTIED